jgi:aspartate 1-decarboxylase
MYIQILKSKINGAVITEANVSEAGSLTLDELLMEAASLMEHEKVQVVNVNSGERIDTYLVKGKRGSGICCLNSPAAQKGLANGIVVIISFCLLPCMEAAIYRPKMVYPKEGNLL